MALKQAVDRANMAQLYLGAGVLSFVLAMTFRRWRDEHLARHKPSKRSKELTKHDTPSHILEHIARLSDPEYVCLSIAENKLTVGPLLDKLLELSSRPLPPPKDRPAPDSTITNTANNDNNVTNNNTDINTNTNANTNANASNTANTTNTINSDGSEADAIARAAAGGPSPETPAAAATTTAGTWELSAATAEAAAAEAEATRRFSSLGYGDERGPFWVRRELAEMMGERMFHREIDPDNLCIAAGAKCILRLLMLVLAEQGQGCLIPGPYFPGFDTVLTTTGVKAWVVNRLPGGGGGVEGGLDEGISPRVLQAGLRRARAADVTIRTLLITSPHNPTGRLYSPKALLGAIAWARKRSLHIIVDEVYAHCVHRPNALFRSVGSLLASGAGGTGMGMGNDVHIMYGLSKDLGVAGWRVGVLYTESKEVMSVVSKLVMTSQSSSDTMDLVGRLFQEPGFMTEFFRQHQEGLRAAYASVVNRLGRRGIMHLQAEAGLFVMLDLREFLEESSKEAEERLWRQMLERTGVNLTPGDAFHCVEPGWFRLCFAYQQNDVVSRSVDRVADFLETIMLERAASLGQAPPPPPPPPPSLPANAAAAVVTTVAATREAEKKITVQEKKGEGEREGEGGGKGATRREKTDRSDAGVGVVGEVGAEVGSSESEKIGVMGDEGLGQGDGGGLAMPESGDPVDTVPW